jgi:heme/copper-type cytochrome/quinol oxidase subunit 2
MKIVARMHKAAWSAIIARVVGAGVLVAGVLLAAGLCMASPHDNPVPSIFEPHSTPAESIRHLSHFVLGVTGVISLVVFSLLSYAVVVIFLVVFSLLSYAIVKFRSRAAIVARIKENVCEEEANISCSLPLR